MKKRISVFLTAIMLAASAIAVLPMANSQVQTVEARCQKVKIISRARLYDHRGHKRRQQLRRGRVVYIYGTRNIKGKNYYRVGHNRYIRMKYAKWIVNPKLVIKPDANNNDTDK